MFNRDKKTLLILAVLALLSNPCILHAEEADIASIDAEILPINTTQPENKDSAAEASLPNTLVVPSKPNTADTLVVSKDLATDNAVSDKDVSTEKAIESVTEPAQNTDTPVAVSKEKESTATPQDSATDDFDFDLKMKSIDAAISPAVAQTQPAEEADAAKKPILSDEDLPKSIQYKTNPIENLGNNILSQMDDDLFSQMSEIEKSTTLLTLELRREKIRNEIEAQKAIRQKAYDDIERQKAEAKLKELERQKQIEAKVIQEQQALVDKQQLLEVLKQRKLLNSYMNYMLVNQQEWLKEKEALYNKLALMEQEKKDLTELFKQKVEKLVEVSQQNMQAAEAAKANFERVVKSLKARNEQLRKRIEADAKIIKNAQNSLYLKSQSLEELKNKNSEIATNTAEAATNAEATASTELEDTPSEAVVAQIKLSAQYAILGITGRGDTMSIEVIDANGQPISLKVGSTLPSGHVLKEIGSDYALFARDGVDEYLYVGRTIDGVIPTLGLIKDKN